MLWPLLHGDGDGFGCRDVRFDGIFLFHVEDAIGLVFRPVFIRLVIATNPARRPYRIANMDVSGDVPEGLGHVAEDFLLFVSNHGQGSGLNPAEANGGAFTSPFQEGVPDT